MAAGLGVLALGLTAWLVLGSQRVVRLVTPPPGGPPPSGSLRPMPVGGEGIPGHVFRGRLPSPGDHTTLAKRWRLAGTFFEFDASGSGLRRAILDDRRSGDQQLVQEFDRLEARYEVRTIMRDRVVLRDPDGREEVLTLTFTGRDDSPVATESAAPAADAAATRFGGSRVGEARWVFAREPLLQYYQDLRDNPERLVQLFDSLKPEYLPDGRIQGYRLQAEGEREFFEAVGLLEGDIVRQVNNVEMTNRRRAEYFVKQFVLDEASAFMIDIERNGTTNRLVYELR